MSAFAFAISLGAQSLVKDVINGFFTLIDGNVIVGDVVTIGNYSGTVESLSIRAIFLRHSTGALQRIPFSEISNIINSSRDYAILPIDIATSYRTDIGHVYEALKRTGEEMVNDITFGKMILEPLTISGIDKFADNAVHVMANFKIKPAFRDTFTREFNRRLKIHMDAANIQPPITFNEQWALPKASHEHTP
jgi:small conductance mechanosensitive channel